MKKILLPITVLATLLGTASETRAQAGLVRLIGAGVAVGRMAGRDQNPAVPLKKERAQSAATMATYRGQPFSMLRTPADKLPKEGADQVSTLETQLDQFHTTMLADSVGIICTPEQRTAIQNALIALGRSRSNWNLQPYHQEAAFYLAENTRRQKATGPVK